MLLVRVLYCQGFENIDFLIGFYGFNWLMIK